MAAPSWSDAVAVLGVTKVAAGGTARATFNVSGKFGGFLFIRAMRLSNGTPSNGLYIRVRRLLTGTPNGGAGTVNINHPGALTAFQDNTTASSVTTLNGAPTIPGQTVTLTSATGFAANQTVGIVDSTTTPTVLEFAQTSKVSGTTLTMDENLTNTGVGNGATIATAAIVLPPVWVDGDPGSGDVEVIFDNGAEATVNYAVEVWGQTLNSIA